MNIRPAELGDLGAIRDIYNEAVLTTTATYDYEARSVEAQAEWFAQHQAQGLPVFVAEEEGAGVTGWVSLNAFHYKPGYRFTVDDSIYIASNQQGKGIGTRLLGAAVRSARSLQLHSIVAVIDEQSEASVRLHRRYGFEEVGRLRQAGFKFDRWLDVVYMQLLLQ